MRSAAHFALDIDVQLSEARQEQEQEEKDVPWTKHEVVFQNYSQQMRWLCKRSIQKGRPTRKIMVCAERYPVPLHKMLSEHFPASEAFTSRDTLHAYWEANGKGFNWTGLPTELKERVIQFCIVATPLHPDRFHGLPRVPQRPAQRLRTCELIDKLGGWKGLLEVSTQVRTITLRLCIAGSLCFEKGLCVTSYGYYNLQGRLQYMDNYSQITEANSVPTKDAKDPGYIFRDAYRETPKLYPELQRYATFFHGIRKMDISFNFIDFYRFFKVTAGGFDQQERRASQTMTYDVFDRLPHLNEIVVRLPMDRNKYWSNSTRHPERPLWHDISPCPRVIFRILYERIAEVLAPYKDVTVKDFLDEAEEERFWCLRRTATKTLEASGPPTATSLTIEELLDLYANTEGGLQLSEEESEVASQRSEPQVESETEGEAEETEADRFYPIHCDCAISCREQYDFYPGW